MTNTDTKKEIDAQAGGHGSPYGTRYRMECKSLFLKHRTIAAVRRELKRRTYKHIPDPRTIEKWCRMEGWREELQRQDEIREPDLDPNADPFDTLFNKIRTNRRHMELDISTLRNELGKNQNQIGQLYHALNRAMVAEAQILKLKKEAAQAKGDTPVEVIFKALKAHPKVGKLLTSAEILSELQELISEEMLEYQRRQVGL